MGVKIYYLLVAAVTVLGIIMPQQGRRKKAYVVIMAIVHTFVCGWRYMYLTGDLRKYAWDYYMIADKGWFSADLVHEGRNTGFFWLMKLLSGWTDGDFQILLIVIAIVIEIAVAMVIYRYSPRPWLSYLLWNCFGFYVFGFSAIKQALAMGILMFSFMSVMENKPWRFLFWTLLAGFVHQPALVFLPAYWLCKRQVDGKMLISCVVAAIAIYIFREPIVTFVSGFYYDETEFSYGGTVGGRFVLMCLFLIAGLLLKRRNGKSFTYTFNLMLMAVMIQMFSSFDHVFTRLADYYFQFLILYLPITFVEFEDEPLPHRRTGGVRIALTRQLQTAAIACLVVFSIWFYHTTNLNVNINPTDDYTNYRFCWEVEE